MPGRNAPKIKIAYILPTLDQGGAERFLLDLMINLDRGRFEPTMILYKRGGAWLEELKAANIPVFILKKRHKIDIKNSWKLVKLIKHLDPDIVHTELGGDIYGRLAAKISNIPVIISTEQNVNPDEKKLYNLVKRLTCKLADAIVAITLAVKDDAIVRYGIAPDRITIIPNGINVDRFPVKKSHGLKPENKKNIIVGTIGRLVPQKGQRFLIEALAQCGPNITCLIAGQGPLENDLLEEIKRLDLDKRITLVGPVSNPSAFLSSLDVFVFPSIWEGQGLALLEAALVGLPIIASNVDGIKEVLSPQEADLILPGNAKALAVALNNISNNLDSPEIINRTDKLKIRISAQYDIRKITQDYQELYVKLLKEKGVYEDITS